MHGSDYRCRLDVRAIGCDGEGVGLVLVYGLNGFACALDIDSQGSIGSVSDRLNRQRKAGLLPQLKYGAVNGTVEPGIVEVGSHGTELRIEHKVARRGLQASQLRHQIIDEGLAGGCLAERDGRGE